MKKKVLCLLIILISFVFIKDIEAKTCKYTTVSGAWKANGANTYDFYDGNYRNSSASFILPSDPSKSQQLKFTFTCDENRGRTRTDNINIDNWSDGVLYTSLGLDATGTQFVISGNCPKAVMVRTGDTCGQGLSWDSFLLNDTTEAKKVLDWGVSSNRWSRKSLLFILEYVPTEEEIEENTHYKSCKEFGHSDCVNNSQYSCLWVTKKTRNGSVSYCNFDDLTYVRCGDIWDIPDKVPGLISFLVNLIKIATPIILIFVSILSLVKAVGSSKEDELKKAQNTLIRRIIAAVIVFFVIQMTQFVVMKVADNQTKAKNGKTESENLSTCLSCFLNNDKSCTSNRYYKTMIGGRYECTNLNGDVLSDCH